jgi:hypothetical protein
VVLGFELRAWSLLGRQALFALVIFQVGFHVFIQSWS